MDASQFSLLIKPVSADCNLTCRYCFYLGHASFYPETKVHRMEEPVLDRLVRDYLGAPQREFSFIWQGGEPALAGLPFFRRVVELQEKYAKTDSSIANSLQTNGTLITDEWASFLAEKGFLVGLSLDGPESLHDAFRKRSGGGGTYRSVMRAAEILERHGAQFNILSVVNAASASRGREIYRHHKRRGFKWLQFIPCVEFGTDGGLLPFSLTGEAWGRFLIDVFDEWIRDDVGVVSVRLFEDIVNYLVLGLYTSCQMMEECGVYFTVEHSGELFPCDFFVERDLRIGALDEETWAYRYWHPQFRGFGRAKARRDPACSSCDYLALCNGDCLKHRPGKFDRPETRSVLCEGYKRFYDHTLGDFRRIAATLKDGL